MNQCLCGCGLLVKGEYKQGHNTRRAWKKVRYLVDPSTGCWIWQLARMKTGHGLITINYKMTTAHRYYYQQRYGKVKRGMHVDHLCKNPSCVNPGHMEVVTPAVNTRRGKSAKLTESQVHDIRAIGRKIRQKILAHRYGVNPGTISRILAGKRWDLTVT